MSLRTVTVIELAAWGFDSSAYRDGGVHAREVAVAVCASDGTNDPRCLSHPLLLDAGLAAQGSRPDLLEEMRGLEWELAVVDLRGLLAFQRRLCFDPDAPPLPVAPSGDEAALLAVAFGPEKPVEFTSTALDGQTVELQSYDPNLQVRPSTDAGGAWKACSGSPFFEVAHYAGRWFLRDGYHRAYHLLRAGIYVVPAVLVWAKTLAELGATQPWFYSEEVLFSARPPRVADFLEDALTVHYSRPRLVKTVRLTMTTSYSAALETGDPA